MLRLIVNGVQINNVFRCGSIILFSTATNSLQDPLTPLADYLVKSLGYSREEAVAASEKVSHLKSTEKPVAVINYLKQIGFQQSHIKSILSYDIHLLGSRDIEKTLIPKIRVFQELGLSDSALGSVMAKNPSILQRSVKSYIKPLVEGLRSVLGSDEVLSKAIQRYPMMLNYSSKRLIPNSSLLRRYGVSGKRLTSLVLFNPWHLVCQTELLERNLKDVETLFEIPRESAQFLNGMYTLSSLSRDTLESKFRVYRSYGWTEAEIKTIVKKLPACLRISKAKTKTGLDFYMKELGYQPVYIASHPKLLMYSFENRILPRIMLWEALKEKKLLKTRGNLYTVIGISNVLFIKNYVMPYKNELPEQCEAYINKTSSSIANA